MTGAIQSDRKTYRAAVRDRAEYGLQLRVGLIEALSPEARCGRCGVQSEHESLEIDHQDGRDWYGRDLNFLDRIRRQWREFDRGVPLRALCRSCNASEGTIRFRGKARYTKMSRREKQARERVVLAALAIAEIRSLSGGMPDPDSALMAEFASASEALRSMISTRGKVE